MDRLQAMHVLVRVIEAGSFSVVAREMGTSQSAISKQVRALEAHLGVRLLSRTTRAVSVTEEGRTYVETARNIVREAIDAEEAVRTHRSVISGRLRIGASNGFGRFVLFPIVRKFMAQHPRIEIDLQLKDSFVDVVAEGLDMVIRVGDLNDSSLIAARVGSTDRSVVASKALAAKLNQEGRVPQTPAALAEHDCVVYTGLSTPSTWVFDATTVQGALPQGPYRVRVKGRFSTSSTEVVREAVISGMGIGFAPNWFFTEELAQGEVVRLLTRYQAHPLPIHALYPVSRRDSAKVAAFIASAREAVGAIA